MELLKVGDRLIPSDRVVWIDVRRLEREGFIDVHIRDEPAQTLAGAEAFDLVMRHAPSFFEGRRFKWQKSMWAVHNLIGHPLMQILAWVGKPRLGLKVHDLTVPRPL